MELLSIQEIVDHCERQLKREPVGSIFYREHEAVKAYLLELLQFRNIDENPAKAASRAALYMEILTRTYGPVKQKIADWLKADQAGRLVVLPCAVGDTVWLSMYDKVKEAKVICIRPFIFQDKVEFRGNAEWTGKDPFYNDGRPLTQEVFIVFGKDAFLTREEAEAALRKEKRE